MTTPNRRINASLWIGQLVLAVIFLTSSYVKTSTPAEELVLNLPWTAALPIWLVRAIGVFEGLGAFGLVLPALLGLRPALTPLAALGITALMSLALIFHLIRGELGSAGGVVLLGMLAGGVAWGRFIDAPIKTADEATEDDPFLRGD